MAALAHQQVEGVCPLCPVAAIGKGERELLSEVGGRVGPGLVRAVCALPSLFRQFFTIARTRDTLWYLIYPSPHRS